ncbi:MAG TPA: chemotaxis protein CheW [Pyrinomonadaceae bacterium]
MEESTQDDSTAGGSTRAGRLTGARRKLCVMRSGARLFAVYADEVAATSEDSRPTPLPFAPLPVRGIVSQRGRILTVIDPLPLLPPDAPTLAATPEAPAHTSPQASSLTQPHAPLIVALRGDEQLALSVERIEHDLELFDDEDDHATDTTANASPGSHLLRRTIRHETDSVAILDTAHLFEAAMQGVERRRRRT